jgi:hypothetical protein
VKTSPEAVTIRSLEELRACDRGTAHRVSLSGELRTVPTEILDYAENVVVLDLSHNHLDSLPDWMAELRSLQVLFLSNNRFREIPRVLGRLPSLRMLGMRACQLEHIPDRALPPSLIWLTLTHNHLQSLPDDIGSLLGLRKVLLAGNALSSLPESCANLRSLELLRLSANHFERFPDWLFQLPNLTWLALAGNPCSTPHNIRDGGPASIPWSRLTLGAELGRGASGPTYRAVYTPPHAGPYEVAVKVFHSPVSSDGDSRDEIAAAVRAGGHPSLTSTIAPFSEHPENRCGLVLELVPNTFRNLAAPPSFESCTRDVYATDETLSFSVALSYASQVAQAASHLHERSIVHGDLYAHNILVDGSHALLGDFGAACIYEGHEALDGKALERIEVRSLGILLEELLELISPADRTTHSETFQQLQSLAQNCVDIRVWSRPSCLHIADELSANARLIDLG